MLIVDLLDNERREIQERILIRAVLHHAANAGVSLTPVGTLRVKILTGEYRPMTQLDLDNIQAHSAVEDAERYVEIENEQWEALAVHDKGTHQQPPY